jgi:hypothetical protein
MGQDPIARRHEAVLECLTKAAQEDDRILAAWLQGSRADGSADEFSDIDLYLAIRDEAYASFDKLAFAERAAPVLISTEFPGSAMGLSGTASMVSCLLEGPAKLDLFTGPPVTFEKAHRPALRMLVDKVGLAARLSTGWEPERDVICGQVERLLSMTFQGAAWPVLLLRRSQWVTHVHTEMTLIHSTIVPLLLLQRDPRAFIRSTFARERMLTEAERRMMEELAGEALHAFLARSPRAAYDAHVHIVDALSEAGQAACAAYDLPYPAAAEQEARAFYAREWPKEA